MTVAIEGYGAFIQQSQDGVTYSTMAEVAKIGGPAYKGKAIDVTHLLSPLGWMEFIPGLVDGGEVTLDLNFVTGQYASLFALIRTKMFFKIVLNTGSVVSFNGFVTGLGLEVPKDDRVSVPVTLKVTNKPVYFL